MSPLFDLGCCCWLLHSLFFRHARRGELHQPRPAAGHCFLRRLLSEPLPVVAKGVGTGEIFGPLFSGLNLRRIKQAASSVE